MTCKTRHDLVLRLAGAYRVVRIDRLAQAPFCAGLGRRRSQAKLDGGTGGIPRPLHRLRSVIGGSQAAFRATRENGVGQFSDCIALELVA
jgi:hypothetical protein